MVVVALSIALEKPRRIQLKTTKRVPTKLIKTDELVCAYPYLAERRTVLLAASPGTSSFIHSFKNKRIKKGVKPNVRFHCAPDLYIILILCEPSNVWWPGRLACRPASGSHPNPSHHTNIHVIQQDSTSLTIKGAFIQSLDLIKTSVGRGVYHGKQNKNKADQRFAKLASLYNWE